jgi:hypothetical protein
MSLLKGENQMATAPRKIPQVDEFDLRTAFEETKSHLINKLNQGFTQKELTLSASYALSHKTISEIGGRLIEEYVSAILESSLRKGESFNLVPTASRSLGDFVIQYNSRETYRFYFDVKAQHLSIRERTAQHYKKMNIQAKKPGQSHPNLIAYHKAKEFFGDSNRLREDIAFLFIHYNPELVGNTVSFNLRDLSDSSICLLRDISVNNLSYGNLGKGQLQLKRVNDLQLENRTRLDFVSLIDKLANGPRKTRASGKN